MAKSPAFLFYTNDFISGTQFFTNEEVGIYIRLLCAQHQHGRLSEKQVKFICNSLENEVLNKFIKDEQGLYYNERLEQEIEKRKKFSESRAENRTGKVKTDIKLPKKKDNTSKSHEFHVEDEIEKENEIDNRTEFQKTFDSFLEMRKKIKKPPTERAIELIKIELKKLSKGNIELAIEILNQSIRNCWQDVFELKTKKQGQIDLDPKNLREINTDEIIY